MVPAMGPFQQSNAQARFSDSSGEAELEKLGLGLDGSGRDSTDAMRTAQHDVIREENGAKDKRGDCLPQDADSFLSKVATTMGLTPSPTTTLGVTPANQRYKPLRQGSTCWNGQAQINEFRSPVGPSADKSISNPLRRSESDEIAQPMRQRRRPSTRRLSDVTALREPIFSCPNGRNGYRSKKGEETRESFELKQNAIYSMQTDGTLEQLSALENLRAEEEYASTQSFWRRLALRASSPDTSQKELIQRSTFLVISSLTVGAGLVWALMYVALEEYTAALMPIIYSVSMSLVLFTCICNGGGEAGMRYGGYETFANCQLALILLLPFAVHVALGGVARSGGVMLWSFLCPMGAAFFRSAEESVRWFQVYMGISALLLVKGFWEATYPETVAPAEVQNGTEWVEVVGDDDASGSRTSVEQLYFLMNILGVKGVIFAAVYLFARDLEKEYAKSEEVLSNILPAPIVKRIKRGEFPIVDHISEVTILFADLVGFTKASTELHPNFLIGLFLRDIFHAFDELVYARGLEKIKTIGDAYMVVGGLDHDVKGEGGLGSGGDGGAYPTAASRAVAETMLLAAEMFAALERVNKKYGLKFTLRIGVHSGPVVAGVLGLKRFTYDVWGDSVNTASRMESNGVPGHIHLSSDFFEASRHMTNVFDFSCCGEIQIKGKGAMTTYLARPQEDGANGEAEQKGGAEGAVSREKTAIAMRSDTY
ncbi:hypothetical protein ACHAWF_008645 [Thalassiosira exigua]